MPNRTERRAAERAARKATIKEFRAQQAQQPAAELRTETTAPPATQEIAPTPQPTGRAISAQNALKHGSCADTLILKHENQSDYDNLSTTWFQSYQPKDQAEAHLIQELINADWYLQRATTNVNRVEADLMDQEPSPSKWTEAQQRTMGRFLRHQTTRANAMHKARKAVEDYRRARAKEAAVIEKREARERKSNANNEPFDMQKLIDDMTKTATALGYRNPDGSKKS